MTKKTRKPKLSHHLLKRSKQVTEPTDVSFCQSLLQQALAHHRAGHFLQAETLYRQILAVEPTQPEALHFLGMLAYQAGKSELAVELIGKALNCRPDYSEAHNNLGIILNDQGKLDEAVSSYRLALSLKPDFALAHNNLGNTLKAKNKLDEAIAGFRKAIALKADFAEAHYNLGITLTEQNKPDEAISCFRQALALNPDYLEAQYNLGVTFKNQGKLDEAVESFNRTLALKPDFVLALNDLGIALKDQGKLDEAIASFQRALSLQPDYAVAHNNLGNVLYDRGRLDEATASFLRALSIKPDFAEAHYNLGNALRDRYLLDEAVACYRRALDFKPDFALALNNMGIALKDQGKLDEAIASCRQAFTVKPDYTEAYSNLLMCLNYLTDIGQEEIFEQSLHWLEQVAKTPPNPDSFHANNKDLDRKLRVGYVSADFRNHSVAFFIEPVLKAHDLGNVEVYCYANIDRPDDTTLRLQAESEHWHSISGQPDIEVVERIRRDEIDILVDLSGHTSGNRLLVFAYKPAPIQVSWLGYPNTTGMRAIDYRLTDAVADPQGEADNFHSEKLIRLEHGFLCYQPDASAPEVAAPPCLERDNVMFGSFNNLAKVTPEVIKVWAEILHKQPRSRLLLKSKGLADSEGRERYLLLFAEEGISAERLELHGWLPDPKNHLELYNRVDIGLDSFPYNGTTTTCEALWMGVPVVTLSGDRHAARVGASILHRVGLGESVAHSKEEYIALAVALAQDRQRLLTLRSSLRQKMRESQLLDKKLFTASLERVYRRMWKEWCAGGNEPQALNPLKKWLSCRKVSTLNALVDQRLWPVSEVSVLRLHPLVVDLDGTLIRTDMLHEYALRLLRDHPWDAFRIPGWLLRGKASCKRNLADTIDFDPSGLPYNHALLDWLKEQRSQGRRLVLCTAVRSSPSPRQSRHT